MVDPLVGERNNWSGKIDAAAQSIAPRRVTAQTYVWDYGSASVPVVFKCDDAKHWVVKAQFAGRGVVSDSAIAVVARALAAPTPETGYCEVCQLLIDAEPSLQNVRGRGPLLAGTWHASRFIDQISETADIRNDGLLHPDINKERFGRLALVFAWCGSGDRQFVYQTVPPPLVHCVDFGHALPGANGWSASMLDGDAGAVSIATDLHQLTGYGRADYQAILNEIPDPIELIARAVATPLSTWGNITQDDRIALAHYLSRRYDKLRFLIQTL